MSEENKSTQSLEDKIDTLFSINGNEDALNELVKKIKTKKMIGFVGAGASFPMCPLWEEVIKKLTSKISKANTHNPAIQANIQFWLRKDQNFLATADEIKKAFHTEEAYKKSVSEIFTGDDYTPTHEKIVRLPLKGLLTTNYDQGLENACHSLPSECRRLPQKGLGHNAHVMGQWQNQEIFSPTRLPILYMHGHFSEPDSIVLGEEDYRKAYSSPVYQSFFQHIWTSENMLFFGFGFRDYWFEFLATGILHDMRPTNIDTRHFAILDIEKPSHYSDAMRNRFLRRYKLNPIFFSTKREDQDEKDETKDYSMVQDILSYLLKQTQEQTTHP